MVDGKAYQVYRYGYVTTTPAPNDTVATLYYDSSANLIFRTVAGFEAGGGKLIQTYMPDDSIELPAPGN